MKLTIVKYKGKFGIMKEGWFSKKLLDMQDLPDVNWRSLSQKKYSFLWRELKEVQETLRKLTAPEEKITAYTGSVEQILDSK
jgi:hypothetical protein